jgi:hypothetical protein
MLTSYYLTKIIVIYAIIVVILIIIITFDFRSTKEQERKNIISFQLMYLCGLNIGVLIISH